MSSQSKDSKVWTSSRVRASKGAAKLTSVTAYDYATARVADDVGVQLIVKAKLPGMAVTRHPHIECSDPNGALLILL